MKKYVIISLILIPTVIAFAWRSPTLTTSCQNTYTITLPKESNQIIEFSFNGFTTITQTTDFVTEGPHDFVLVGTNTLSSRYRDDHNATISVPVSTLLCPHINPPSSPPPPPTPSPSSSTSNTSGSCAYGYSAQLGHCNYNKVDNDPDVIIQKYIEIQKIPCQNNCKE